MKKFLLSMAVLAAVTAMNAQAFKLSYCPTSKMDNYTEIANGSTVTVNTFEDGDEDPEFSKQYWMTIPCYFKLDNLSGGSLEMQMSLTPVAAETTLKLPEGVTFCTPAGCASNLNEVMKWEAPAGDGKADAGFHIVYELGGMNQMTPIDFSSPETYGKWTGNVTLKGGVETLNFKLVLERRVADGIEGIGTDAESAPAVYYNLQGQKVENPQAGKVYIRQQGGNASKVVL